MAIKRSKQSLFVWDCGHGHWHFTRQQARYCCWSIKYEIDKQISDEAARVQHLIDVEEREQDTLHSYRAFEAAVRVVTEGLSVKDAMKKYKCNKNDLNDQIKSIKRLKAGKGNLEIYK